MPLKARSAKAKGTKLEKKVADSLEKDCENAKGQADFLVIERDYGQPCVYMTWNMFSELCLEIYELNKQLKGSKDNESSN